MLNGKYIGQKLIKEVNKKARATMPNTIAVVPEITLVKYKIAITMAAIKRIALSMLPIFFFMLLFFNEVNKNFSIYPWINTVVAIFHFFDDESCSK